MSSKDEIINNRSEIVFLYDAERANPNGNPMSSENSPRVDRETGHAIVTDVRLKRYIRDQLTDEVAENDQTVYIRNTGDNLTREELLEDVFPSDLKEMISTTDEDELDENVSEVRDKLLSNAIDIRWFGATFSVGGGENDDNLMSIIGDKISSFTGPIQFSPAMSLNAPVQFNEEYDSLTSVISNDDDSEGGGFDLDDKRLRYAVFPFHGIVNENVGQDMKLTNGDIDLFDEVLWKSIKNQTLTRSKMGQEPRLYVRVEYQDDSYHIGGLHNELMLHNETPEPEKLRSGNEVCLDVTAFVDRLSDKKNHIECVHVRGSSVFDYSYEDNIGSFSDIFVSNLENRIGDDRVHEVKIYDK